jgi:pimeloyl-ACP methyl ester carboxylesterase
MTIRFDLNFAETLLLEMSYYLMEINYSSYAVNGIQLHVAAAGRADNGIIIFLHGFPEFNYAWHRQLIYFARQGYQAVAPDQRGYNLSSKPKGIKAYNLQYLVDDVAGLIKQLTPEKVYLVGHDWGGGVAWTMAQQRPELLHKLIILNMPHLQVMKNNLKTNPLQMLKSWYAAFFQLPVLPELTSRLFNFKLLARSLTATSVKGTFNKAVINQYKAAWRKPYALSAMINWYRAFKYNQVSTDRNIHVPTLLIWGKQDAALSYNMAVQSISRCVHGKLVIFEDATHWVHHEKADEVNELINSFVDE